MPRLNCQKDCRGRTGLLKTGRLSRDQLGLQAACCRIKAIWRIREVTTRLPNSNRRPQAATTSCLIALPPQVQPLMASQCGDGPWRSNQPPRTEYRPSSRAVIMYEEFLVEITTLSPQRRSSFLTLSSDGALRAMAQSVAAILANGDASSRNRMLRENASQQLRLPRRDQMTKGTIELVTGQDKTFSGDLKIPSAGAAPEPKLGRVPGCSRDY